MATLEQIKAARVAKNDGFLKIDLKDCSGQVFYRKAGEGYYQAKGYKGRQEKHDFFYRFKTQADAQAYVEKWHKQLVEMEGKAQQRKEASKAHNIQVGDIFYSSWGYEQTNIDFYQVTAVLKGSVKIREIEGSYKATGDMTGYKSPLPGQFVKDSKEMLKRIQTTYDNRPALTITSYASAWPAEYKIENGKKVYRSYYESHYA